MLFVLIQNHNKYISTYSQIHTHRTIVLTLASDIAKNKLNHMHLSQYLETKHVFTYIYTAKNTLKLNLEI